MKELSNFDKRRICQEYERNCRKGRRDRRRKFLRALFSRSGKDDGENLR